MSDIQLKTPIDQSFTRAKSGVVWGRIYFEIDCTQFFPNNEWTDMVVPFAAAWLRALFRLADGQSVRESVRFYDGPFAVNLSLPRPSMVELSFIHNDAVHSIVEARLVDLLRGAISAAKESLAACTERNWSNADTESLAALVKSGDLGLDDAESSRT